MICGQRLILAITTQWNSRFLVLLRSVECFEREFLIYPRKIRNLNLTNEKYWKNSKQKWRRDFEWEDGAKSDSIEGSACEDDEEFEEMEEKEVEEEGGGWEIDEEEEEEARSEEDWDWDGDDDDDDDDEQEWSKVVEAGKAACGGEEDVSGKVKLEVEDGWKWKEKEGGGGRRTGWRTGEAGGETDRRLSEGGRDVEASGEEEDSDAAARAGGGDSNNLRRLWRSRDGWS